MKRMWHITLFGYRQDFTRWATVHACTEFEAITQALQSWQGVNPPIQIRVYMDISDTDMPVPVANKKRNNMHEVSDFMYEQSHTSDWSLTASDSTQ